MINRFYFPQQAWQLPTLETQQLARNYNNHQPIYLSYPGKREIKSARRCDKWEKSKSSFYICLNSLATLCLSKRTINSIFQFDLLETLPQISFVFARAICTVTTCELMYFFPVVLMQLLHKMYNRHVLHSIVRHRNHLHMFGSWIGPFNLEQKFFI